MRSRRYYNSRRTKTMKKRVGGATGKKWTTAIQAATKTLNETGSLNSAKKSLRKQALTNARKLFGSVGTL
jgi:hypothetical protein